MAPVSPEVDVVVGKDGIDINIDLDLGNAEDKGNAKEDEGAKQIFEMAHTHAHNQAQTQAWDEAEVE